MHTSIFERTTRGIKEVLRYTVGDKGEAVPSNPKNMWHKDLSKIGIRIPVSAKKAGPARRVKVTSGKQFLEALPLYLKGSYVWAVFVP